MVSFAITDPNDTNCDNDLFFFPTPLFSVLYAKEHIHRNGLSKTTQSNHLVALYISPPFHVSA